MIKVGVVVGRFQVDELTPGHINLITTVMDRNDLTIVVIGEAIVRTKYDPLDVETRTGIIKDAFPLVKVLSLLNTRLDIEWSKNLDNLIARNIPPYSDVTMYGSRTSFLDQYNGRYNTQYIDATDSISGTNQRELLGCRSENDNSFRRGVIWAHQNMYNPVYMMVDIAPIGVIDGDRCIIMIKKNEDGGMMRFVGGHVEPLAGDRQGEELEAQAMKEAFDETGVVCSKETVNYVGSFRIDDWRYPKGSVISAFFIANEISGSLKAGDDADEVYYIKIDDFLAKEYVIAHNIVSEHWGLAEALRRKLQ
jgi:ADP-ribose pyrophosphatase YjhB (NUDIX family)